MPKDKQIKKVLVIGSGPIVIGQAAEFDYAGTQACLTLKAEGCEVVLINNNPATIMTDENMADKIYFEPLTSSNIEAIIKKEKPDGILATVSGQTGLNLAFTLQEKGILDQYQVKVLGTSIDAIMRGEDREKFRTLMQEMNEPIPDSRIISSLKEAKAFLKHVSLPIIIRPAYTLGGSGGGIAETEEAFIKYVTSGLRASPIHQCLIEKSIAGWKEIEFEVICDHQKQAAIVCHMENMDPVGVHTGDSIVVAPIQTLSKEEINTLKAASIRIVKELGIIGACNVQLGYDSKSGEYMVIEINPRVSRSSALASKATGYPIAKIATKLSLGYGLDELYHHGAKETLATFEPDLDYKVVKFPSWPFDKLTDAKRELGTQMKATGEVMAIEHTVHAGLQKAARSLNLKLDGLRMEALQQLTNQELETILSNPDDRRFFAILEGFYRDYSADELYRLTKIDHFFLQEINMLAILEKTAGLLQLDLLSSETLLKFKQAGFTNKWLSEVLNCCVKQLEQKLSEEEIYPVYEQICAYSEEAGKQANYYYAVWKKGKQSAAGTSKQKVLIIGSGPIQIGQGIEFDYCSVQGVNALKNHGYETIMVNNNPATVSTDYEIADKLYFEPITAEDVLHVLNFEDTNKVIIQFGGQTAINLAEELEMAGVELLGSVMDTIDMLEDRDRFYQYAKEVNVPHIPGVTVEKAEEMHDRAAEIGYPVLIRPSYVIGGKGMAILDNEAALDRYMEQHISYPVLLDAYYPGKEAEVDIVTDGEQIVIPAIFEHIEKAGVHSGDSMAVTPPISLTSEQKEQIVVFAERIAKGMDFKGIFNIQFVIYKNEVYVLEVNPRASRTVPIVSKVTGVNMIKLAAGTLLGEKVTNLCKQTGLLDENSFYTVKAPVFSTIKLPGVDPKLVPEMKSTGEVIALDATLEGGMTKAFIWNETLAEGFAKEKKEMYMQSFDPHFVHVSERCEKAGIHVISETEPHLEDWFKSPEALAVYSTETDSTARKRALECQLLVMSAEETVRAFSMITDENFSVQDILQFQLKNKKEVILK